MSWHSRHHVAWWIAVCLCMEARVQDDGVAAATAAGGLGAAPPGLGTWQGTGPTGLSSARSGLGLRSSPIFNPSPSLTPHEVLNPAGSLSTGQVLHPDPSLHRPRAAGTATMGGLAAPYRLRWSTPTEIAWGPRLSQDARQLSRQLDQYANGDSWKRYLRLDKLIGLTEQAHGDPAVVRGMLNRYERVARDPYYGKIAGLRAFRVTHQSLTLYSRALPPVADRRG